MTMSPQFVLNVNVPGALAVLGDGATSYLISSPLGVPISEHSASPTGVVVSSMGAVSGSSAGRLL